MTDVIGEQGAAIDGVANPDATASRLGGAGHLKNAIAVAIANGTANASASRLGAQGRIFALAGGGDISFGLPGGSAWSPLSLFASSEVGVWYDPSDLTTMFQDSAGTTPVTATGDPVGLILDKSQGLVLGSELVGTPVTGAETGGGTWVFGTDTVSGSSTHMGFYISLPSGTSATKEVRFTASGVSGGTAYVATVPSVPAITRVAADGDYVLRIKSTDDVKLLFVPYEGTNGSLTLSNISVKELPGNHASQATAAFRPVLRQDGSGYYYLECDGVDDSLATAAIDFTATDKVSIFTGVNRVLNTAGRKTIVMGVGDCNSVNGSFELDTPTDPSTTGTYCRGTQISGLQFAPTAAHAVLTAQYDLAGGGYASNTKLRENAVALVGVESGNQTTGGGNFGNGIIRIGAIIDSSGYFGGYIYSIIVRGALSDSTQIDDAEAYVNSKTGAY